MEHFLENVADSVSQLVLFSVDTTDENTNSVEQGTKIVEQSAKALSDIINKLASLESPEMKDKLGDASKDVTDGIQQIVENARTLAGNLSNTDAKKGVLDGSKKLLQNMVNCLQLTDIYQCASLIKKSKELLKQMEELRAHTTETRSEEAFTEIAKQLVTCSISLIVEADERSQLIPQLKYYELVQDAKMVLAKDTQELITVSVKCLEDAENKEAEEQRQRLEQNVLQALEDIIVVAQESSKGLFDNLSVDLDLMTVMESASGSVEDKGLYRSIRLTKDALSQLIEFTKKGDKHNSIDQLKAIRPLLAVISSHITGCLTANDLVAMTKTCLLNPNDESHLSELCSSVDRLQSALDILLERANLPTSLTDDLRETIKQIISECEITIESLAQNVFLSDQPKAIQNAKAALKLLNSACELAAGLADRLEDEALTAYFLATNRAIKSTMPPLLTTTKSALLYSEHRPEFIRAKDFALYAAFALLPPKNVVHPENQILDQIKFIQEHLSLLRSAVMQDDSLGIQGSLKGVLEAAKDGARAIQAYIPFANNPGDLQTVCLSLVNDYMQNLGHAVVEKGNTTEQILEVIQTTCLANAQIVTVVLTNIPKRMGDNETKLKKLFTQFTQSSGAVLVEETIPKIQDLVNEQVLLGLASSGECGNPKQKKHLVSTSTELGIELSTFNEEFSKHDHSGQATDLLKEKTTTLQTLATKLVTPVKGDSNELLERISTLPIDDSTTGKLYAASKLIALDLKELLGGELSGADMIKCARRICNQAHIIVKQAQLFISKCRDRRLSNQLQVGSMSARTKCVQLKIICAVKAANGDSNDSSMEEQLVGCVLGLTKDLHSTISVAEIAALTFG